MSENLQIVITAIQKGVKQTIQKTSNEISTGFKRGQLAVKAFNDTVGAGNKTVSSLAGSIRTLLGAYAGLAGLREVTNIIKNADQAAFNLQSSVAAANREFKNTGSVKDWESSIKKLSYELVIYSDTALKSAVSRTVDMTKRMGLSKKQMEEVIKRSADLGAGKTDLVGAIERVTAALRGEAEASEYLGLTLNENYIKAWYEAAGATQGAWKDLNDMQKAQLRYLVLLEQSNEFQGRAAKSANTFGGALLIVRKEIENAVLNNKNVTDSMNDLAVILRENAGDIGEVISTLLTWMTKAIEIAVKYKNVILSFVALAVVSGVITKITLTVEGLNAAFTVMTGLGIVKWLGSLRLALNEVAVSGTLAAAGLYAIVGTAALLGAINIYKLTKEIFSLNSALKENKKIANQHLTEAKKYEYAKDTEIKSKKELLKLSESELKAYKENTKAAMLYYSSIQAAATLNSTDAIMNGLLPIQSKKGAENERKAKKLNKTTNEYIKALKEASEAGKILAEEAAGNTGKRIASVRKLKDAEIEGAKKATAAIKKELEQRLADHEKLTNEIAALQNKLIDQQASREDDLREIKRRGMDAESKQYDLSKQASEKIAAAQKILKKGVEELTEADFKRAESLATQGKDIAKGLEYEYDAVKKTGQAWDVLDEIVRAQEKNKRAELDKTIKKIAELEKKVEAIEKDITINVEAATAQAETAVKSLQTELAKLKNKIITVTVIKKTKEAKQSGGTVGMATGGKLPGYGGGDKIDALLEAGEYVVRKEAVGKYGSALFHAFNNMTMPLKLIPHFAKGGMAGFKDIRRKVQLSMDPHAPYQSNGITYHINNTTFYNHIDQTASSITQPAGIKAAANMTGIFKDAVVHLQSGGAITDSLANIRGERDLIERSYAGQIEFARQAGEYDIAKNLAQEKNAIETLAAELELTLAELELEYHAMLSEIESTYENTKAEIEDALLSTQNDLVEKKLNLEKQHLSDVNDLKKELSDMTIALNQAKIELQPTVVKYNYGMGMSGTPGAEYARKTLPLNAKQREAKASISGLQKEIRIKENRLRNEKEFYDLSINNIADKEAGAESKYDRNATAAANKKDRTSELAGRTYAIGTDRAETTAALSEEKIKITAHYDRLKITNEMEREIFRLQAQMHRDLMNMQKNYSGGTASVRHWLAAGGHIPAYADGGGVFKKLSHPYIPGFGNKDDVPAMLMKGEFVLNKKAVKKYGLDFLNSLNNMSTGISMIPQFAAGGLVDMKRKLHLAVNPLAPFSSDGTTYHIGHQSFHTYLQGSVAELNSVQGKASAANMLSAFSQGAVHLQEGGGITSATQMLAAEKLRVSEDYAKQIEFAKSSGAEEIAWALEEERLELEQLANDLQFTLEEMAAEYAFLKAELQQEFSYTKEETIQNHKEAVAQLIAEKTAIETDYKNRKKEYSDSLKRTEQKIRDLEQSAKTSASGSNYYTQSGTSELYRTNIMSYSQKQAYDADMRQTIADTEVKTARQKAALTAAETELATIKRSYTGIESEYKRASVKNTAALDKENNLYPHKISQIENKFEREDKRADTTYTRDSLKTTKTYDSDTAKTEATALHSVNTARTAMEKEIHKLESDLAKELAALQKEYASTSMTGVKYWLAEGGHLGYPAWAAKGKDSIRAMLTPGEYVMKESVVKKFGKAFFDKLNNFQIPSMPHYADGGMVGALSSLPEASSAFDGSVTFKVGGDSYKMYSSGSVAQTLVKELRKMGMATG